MTKPCEYCGQEHDIRRLCHRVISRRAFTSLVGLGLLGLKFGPHPFNARAPMIGPRIEALAADGTLLASTRLQEGVLSYSMISNPSTRVFVADAAVRGTPFNFVSAVNINIEQGDSLSFTMDSYHGYPEHTVYFAGCALSMPGGLSNTIPEIKQRIVNGECSVIPVKVYTLT